MFSFPFVSAQSYEAIDEISCPMFLDDSNGFLAQKNEMEYKKQQLKSAINDSYTAIYNSWYKQEKESLKNQISLRRKEIIVLNYKLFLLYKNKYLSKTIY